MKRLRCALHRLTGIALLILTPGALTSCGDSKAPSTAWPGAAGGLWYELPPEITEHAHLLPDPRDAGRALVIAKRSEHSIRFDARKGRTRPFSLIGHTNADVLYPFRQDDVVHFIVSDSAQRRVSLIDGREAEPTWTLHINDWPVAWARIATNETGQAQHILTIASDLGNWQQWQISCHEPVNGHLNWTTPMQTNRQYLRVAAIDDIAFVVANDRNLILNLHDGSQHEPSALAGHEFSLPEFGRNGDGTPILCALTSHTGVVHISCFAFDRSDQPTEIASFSLQGVRSIAQSRNYHQLVARAWPTSEPDGFIVTVYGIVGAPAQVYRHDGALLAEINSHQLSGIIGVAPREGESWRVAALDGDGIGVIGGR